MELRPLGNSGLKVSTVALGCWPIAGLTTPGVRDEESLATIRVCFELGVNHLDTAYVYGRDGESERLIAEALGPRRAEMVIATKCGLFWDAQKQQGKDGRPETIRRQCEESLRRLQTDRVELLYLHAPDPRVPVGESAGAIARLIEEGKVLAAGASNVSVAELEEFAAACPLSAYQPPYNMLQRQIERDTLPWCREHNVAVLAYWPLMKGLLAGRLPEQPQFVAGDSRWKYPHFYGEEWEKNRRLIAQLQEIAVETGISVAELVIGWTIRQPGITAALCGARKPEQIRENARGGLVVLTVGQLARIEQALTERGPAALRMPV